MRMENPEPVPTLFEWAGGAPALLRMTTIFYRTYVPDDPLLGALFVILLCLSGGKVLVGLMAGTGFILPDFVFCLLLGVVIRNASTLTGIFRVSETTVDVVGNVALSLFLVMALMTMRLLDLVNLAGPLLVILAAQTVVIALFDPPAVRLRLTSVHLGDQLLDLGHHGAGKQS